MEWSLLGVGCVLALQGLVFVLLYYFYRSGVATSREASDRKGGYANVALSEPRGGAHRGNGGRDTAAAAAASSSSSLSSLSSSSSCDSTLAISVVNPQFGDAHTFTLFWLHGLGDTAEGWRDGVAAMQIRHTRVVLPTAPVRPVTINGGMAMNAWFDIAGLTIGAREDVSGIDEACTALAALIKKEIAAGIAPERIAIGGFSQGGAVALHTVFVKGFLDQKIGAVVGLSSWLPRGAQILRGGRNMPKMSSVNASTPVFMGHGTNDPMVQVQFGELSAKILKDGGAPTTWKTYRVQHTTCAREMIDVRAFLSEQLK